jgi:hypothetical protein
MISLISHFEQLFLNSFKHQLIKAMTESKMETQKKFNTRAFISTGMLISFIGLPFSGTMNHILGFDGLTIQRHLWMSVHNVLAVFFTIFAVWHVILNRKPVLNALKKVSNIFISKEAAYAATLILFFLSIFILHAVHLR